MHDHDSTVWKFQEFSVTQILREINFGDFRSANSAVLTDLEALNFSFCTFLHFPKTEIHQMNKIQSIKIGKKGSFRTFRLSKIDFT